MFSDTFRSTKGFQVTKVNKNLGQPRIYTSYNNTSNNRNYYDNDKANTSRRHNERHESTNEEAEDDCYESEMYENESTFSNASEMASSSVSDTNYNSKSFQIGSTVSYNSHSQRRVQSSKKEKVGDRYENSLKDSNSVVSSIKTESNYFQEDDSDSNITDNPMSDITEETENTEWQDIKETNKSSKNFPLNDENENNDTLSTITNISKQTNLSGTDSLSLKSFTSKSYMAGRGRTNFPQ